MMNIENTFIDAYTIFKREMLVFKSNIRANTARALIFPLIILIFFGNLGSASSNVPIAVVNLANNPQSLQFINTLESHSAVSIKAITNENAAMSMLRSGSVYVVLVIAPNFGSFSSGATSIYEYYSSSDITNAGSALSFIQLQAANFGAHVIDRSSVQSLSLPSAPSSAVKEVSLSGTKASYEEFLVAGVLAMIVVFGTMFGGGFSVITDRQLGTMKALFITPVTKTSIILGKMFSGTLQAVLYVIVTLIIAFMLGSSVAMGIIGVVWIFLLSFVVALGFSALSIALAANLKKVELYAIIANVFTLPLWFLSGAFFPASSMPAWMRVINAVDPLTYAVNGIRSIMLNGTYPLPMIALQFSVLIGFAIAMFVICLKSFKNTI